MSDAQQSSDPAASKAAAAMRALPQYEREWLIHEGEQSGKVFDMRHIWRGGFDAMTQEGLFW